MIVFWLLAITLISSAIFVVSAPKPVYSVVGLLVNFIALAAMYITLSAEFLAVTQILVYSGAILVLFVFVIAMLSSGIGTLMTGPDRLPRIPIVAVVAIIVSLVAILSATGAFHLASPPPIVLNAPAVGSAAAFGSVADFGAALFTHHVLPFELTALILLVAIVGVVMIAGGQTADLAVRPQSHERVRRQEREAILREGDAR